MTPDVNLRPPVFVLTGRAYRGHAGIEEWLRDVDESFSTAQIHPLEMRDLGDRVLALTEFEVEAAQNIRAGQEPPRAPSYEEVDAYQR